MKIIPQEVISRARWVSIVFVGLNRAIFLCYPIMRTGPTGYNSFPTIAYVEILSLFLNDPVPVSVNGILVSVERCGSSCYEQGLR